MNEQQTFGTYNFRRIIVVVFILAAVAGGVATAAQGTQATQVEPAAAMATVAPAEGASGTVTLCDGSAVNTACATVEGNDAGPVIAIGYGSAAQAKFHCPSGEVIVLYRQNQIVGYGCGQ